MIYLVLQLHFWLYTHFNDEMADNLVMPLLIGSLVGLCLATLVI